MDCGNKSEKKQSLKKWKILGKKSEENYLLNLISFIINNNFRYKKSTDFILEFSTNSDISSINGLIYNLTLQNTSIINKEDKYNIFGNNKDFNLRDLRDEYYKQQNFFKNINIELMPSFKKDIYLNLSSLPFFYYDNKKKIIKKYSVKSQKKDNNFILCVYLSKLNKNNLNVIKDLNKIDNIFEHFKEIYLILEVNKEKDIIAIINENSLDNLGNDNIKCVFYLFNSTDGNNNNKFLYNIFKEKNNFYPEFFFILDSSNKVIKIKKDLQNLVSKINGFKFYLEKLKKENKNYNNELLTKRENKKKENYYLYKELILFILNMKNFNYVFDFEFNLSFNATLNEECTDIFLKEINNINLKGILRSKDLKYISNLINLIKIKNKKSNIKYKFEELQTINIDIDFTDMKCFKCSKLIQENRHLYYCYICKVKYCYECVNEQLKKEGKEKYIDQKHNLLFFKTRNKKDFICLDRPRFGNNKFAESSDNKDFSETHSAICNGCRGGFYKMPRYVCLHCRPGIYLTDGYIDYCQDCIEKMCTYETMKRELEEKANHECHYNSNHFIINCILLNRHSHDQHIYLLLPLQYNKVDHPYNNY